MITMKNGIVKEARVYVDTIQAQASKTMRVQLEFLRNN